MRSVSSRNAHGIGLGREEIKTNIMTPTPHNGIERKKMLRKVSAERKSSRDDKVFFEARYMSELEKNGNTLREIAKHFGISHEGVRQRILKYKAGLLTKY